MPEINNSLALGIKADPIDIMKPLMGAAQINSLRAGTAKTQQDVDYNQFLQDQGGGLRPAQQNELADYAAKRADLRGRFANRLYNDPTDVDGTIKEAKDNGTPLTDQEQQKLKSMTKQERQQWAMNHRNAAMSSESNMGVTGETTANQGRFIPQGIPSNEPVTSRTNAAIGGGGQQRFITNGIQKPTQAQVDNAIKTGRNFDGSPRVLSTANVTGAAPAPSFNDRAGDMFTPQIVRGPDGSLSSSVTPATQALQAGAADQYQKAKSANDAANSFTVSLDMMDHSADVLNSSGWSSTGAGANAKMSAAKSVNSMLQTFGLPPAVDPTKISNWEDLNKETARAGFKLANTLGSGVAATIVQTSVGAVPSAENTAMGFKLVTNGIRQAVQREKDFYNFATDWASSHRGNTFGADSDDLAQVYRFDLAQDSEMISPTVAI
jgi:hypothetical protein